MHQKSNILEGRRRNFDTLQLLLCLRQGCWSHMRSVMGHLTPKMNITFFITNQMPYIFLFIFFCEKCTSCPSRRLPTTANAPHRIFQKSFLQNTHESRQITPYTLFVFHTSFVIICEQCVGFIAQIVQIAEVVASPNHTEVEPCVDGLRLPITGRTVTQPPCRKQSNR